MIPPLQLASASLGGGFGVVAAPGAGYRNRVYAIVMNTVAANLWGALNDAVGNEALLTCSGPGNASLTFPGGYAMAPNSALNYAVGAGAGNMQISVYYTVELEG